ncbi:MAG TPA: carboxypeptidase regulatory-like domain-containing protein [Thermoanaerobaculia bacterium]
MASTSVIHGKVLEIEDSVELPGVEVCIKGTNICTSTDAKGDFDLNVPADSLITLTATLAGTSEHLVSTCADGRRVQLLIDDTATIHDCTFMGPPEEERYGVRGRVVSGGRPVSRAALTILTLQHKTISSGRSDRRGRFALKGFPEGTYILQISKPGYDEQRVTFRVQYCASEKNITVPLLTKCDK